MATVTHTIGAGTLTLQIVGVSSGSGTDFSTQITSAKITPSASRPEPIHVLSGNVISGLSSYTADLEVSVLQDWSTGGLVDFSWKNAGKTAKFVYTPNTADKAKLEGEVIVDPITIGGEANARATAEFKWTCPALPRFTPKT